MIFGKNKCLFLGFPHVLKLKWPGFVKGVCRILPAKDEYPDFGGTRLVGQNMSLIKINTRNELFSNYHKF